MSNKKNWHKEWRVLPNGRRLHSSGLEFERSGEKGVWVVYSDSMALFETNELSRGVPKHDLINRLVRLSKECMQWREAIFRQGV